MITNTNTMDTKPTFYSLDIIGEIAKGMKTENKALFRKARATNPTCFVQHKEGRPPRDIPKSLFR